MLSLTEKMVPCWEKGSTFSLCFVSLCSLPGKAILEIGRAGGMRRGGESPAAPKRLTYISDFLLSCTSNIPTAGGDNQTEQPHTTRLLPEHLG